MEVVLVVVARPEGPGSVGEALHGVYYTYSDQCIQHKHIIHNTCNDGEFDGGIKFC